MDNMILLDYLRWADEAIFSLVRSLDGQLLTDEIAERTGTLHDKLLHLAEEYKAWLYDIQDIDYTNEVAQYSHASTHELMAKIEQLHSDWKNFIGLTDCENFVIKEAEGMAMDIHIDEVVFNLVNHSSYHRGQIIQILRALDVEVPITDFYWFKIARR